MALHSGYRWLCVDFYRREKNHSSRALPRALAAVALDGFVAPPLRRIDLTYPRTGSNYRIARVPLRRDLGELLPKTVDFVTSFCQKFSPGEELVVGGHGGYFLANLASRSAMRASAASARSR